MNKIAAGAGTTTVVLNLNPAITLESWYGTTVSVVRGPILYSLNIPGNYTVRHSLPSRHPCPLLVASQSLTLAEPFRPTFVGTGNVCV